MPDNSRQGSGICPELHPAQLTSFFKDASGAAEVLELVSSHHASFNQIHTTTALHRTAKHMQSADEHLVLSHPGFSILLGLADNQALSFNARQTATALWAFTRLPCTPSDRLLAKLVSSLDRNLPASSPHDLANSIWSLASLGHDPGQALLAAVAERASALFQDKRATDREDCSQASW